VRILFPIHYPVFGGPHNQALRLAPRLHARGVDLVVALPREAGNAADRLRDAGVAVTELDLRRPRPLREARANLAFGLAFTPDVLGLRRVILEGRFDLVLIAGLVTPHAAFAAKLAAVPLVWQIVDTRVPPIARRAIMPLVGALADAVMTTGTAVARLHGADAFGRRLVIFYPPVDTDEFAPSATSRASARAELGLSESDLVIGTVANVNPQKGHHTFVRAAGALARTRQARFVVLGAQYAHRAGYVASLRDLAASLGIRPDVDLIMRDPDRDVARLLNAFDVFWLCSEPRSEGAPTVIGEAMATGIPVVSVDVGSVREIIVDSETGRIVPVRDHNAIARATLDLLRRVDLAAMRRAARRKAEELFGLDACLEAHLRAFETARGATVARTTA
jgi:glycosyltransferase involved in cell wall biosynthesis